MRRGAASGVLGAKPNTGFAPNRRKPCIFVDSRGGVRTHTGITPHRILSPVRLPIPPRGQRVASHPQASILAGSHGGGNARHEHARQIRFQNGVAVSVVFLRRSYRPQPHERVQHLFRQFPPPILSRRRRRFTDRERPMHPQSSDSNTLAANDGDPSNNADAATVASRYSGRIMQSSSQYFSPASETIAPIWPRQVAIVTRSGNISTGAHSP
jgi:hypothetical protein